MHKLCKSSECKWNLLTITEITAHANKLETHHARGEVVGKLRKWRSDAGVKCKRQEDGIDSDNERPKKNKVHVSVRRL